MKARLKTGGPEMTVLSKAIGEDGKPFRDHVWCATPIGDPDESGRIPVEFYPYPMERLEVSQ